MIVAAHSGCVDLNMATPDAPTLAMLVAAHSGCVDLNIQFFLCRNGFGVAAHSGCVD